MYSTLDDIKKVLPEANLAQLTDDENAIEIKTDKVDEAILQADGEIDVYLDGRYSVPLSTVPAIIKKCSCDITIYNLYKRRMEEIPKTRLISYKDAIKILGEIRDGKMNLNISSTVTDFSFNIITTSHFG